VAREQFELPVTFVRVDLSRRLRDSPSPSHPSQSQGRCGRGKHRETRTGMDCHCAGSDLIMICSVDSERTTRIRDFCRFVLARRPSGELAGMGHRRVIYSRDKCHTMIQGPGRSRCSHALCEHPSSEPGWAGSFLKSDRHAGFYAGFLYNLILKQKKYSCTCLSPPNEIGPRWQLSSTIFAARMMVRSHRHPTMNL
jgi:hypothetical protein